MVIITLSTFIRWLRVDELETKLVVSWMIMVFWQCDPNQLVGIISHYFSNIFSLAEPARVDIDVVLATVQPSLPASLSVFLDRPFVSANVKEAVFNMVPTKAPDGG
ncbi:hypothetical protein ACOSP7_014586 [Xanthoceras sorbifolium]